jgi:HEAT repeat protein
VSGRPPVLAALLLAGACGGGEEPAERPAPAPFELRDVVRAAVQALEREHPEPPLPEPAEEERVRGLVTLAADPAGGSMRAIALEEAAGLGDACLPTLSTVVLDAQASGAERQAAVELLGALATARAAEVLLGLVETAEEPWLRAHAAWRLGDAGEDWVVPRLVLRLKYEDDHDTVIWLARSLAALGNFCGAGVLHVVATTSSDETLRASAAARLQEIGTTAGFPDGYALWKAWDAGEDAEPFRYPHSVRHDLEVWRLIERFFDFQLRGVDDARYVLQRLDARAAELMGEALHDASVYVRVHVAQSLQRMGRRGRPAGPVLLAGLADPALAPNAAEALGSLAFAPAEAALRERLGPGTAPELRLSCARGLGGFGEDPGVSADTVARLREVLDRPDEPVELRQAAGDGLAALGRGRAVARVLATFLVSTEVEPASSERALAGWLASEAAEAPEGPAAAALARWNELALPTDRIVATEEKRAARAARREVVEDLLDQLVAPTGG